jgi:hypothetical protein
VISPGIRIGKNYEWGSNKPWHRLHLWAELLYEAAVDEKRLKHEVDIP